MAIVVPSEKLGLFARRGCANVTSLKQNSQTNHFSLVTLKYDLNLHMISHSTTKDFYQGGIGFPLF